MTGPSDIILRTENLGKRFGGFTALKGVSVEFRRGGITSIIGPNGAGKSTYFNLLSTALYLIFLTDPNGIVVALNFQGA